MTRPARNNDAALAAFLARKQEIDAMLARLADLSDDGFGVHPDHVTWGDAGTLGHHAELLRRICDAAFGEGEHAGS